MRLHISDQSSLKPRFIAAGALAGVLASGWYLYRNLHLTVPDPVWTRFINISLILFVSIYAANLMRRIVELLMKKRKQE